MVVRQHVRPLLRGGRRVAASSAARTSLRWPDSSTRGVDTNRGIARKPPSIPHGPSSLEHSDLSTFQAYAKRSGLDIKSTVYVGTHYEYTINAILSRYGFSLTRVGGVSDLGIDLVGSWNPPSIKRPMKAIVQCKAGAQSVGPQHIRELEGAYIGAPALWSGDDLVALLVSEREATKGVRDALGRSRWPMGYVCCTKDGLVRQMVWNRKAGDAGLEGYGVTLKHYDGEREAELVLTKNGKALPLLK